MIPKAYVTHWRKHAPWPEDAQVEQDLVLSRALVELFQDSVVSEALAFRGGTALHKLGFDAPARYSEDLDFVQVSPGGIGRVFDAIRDRLGPWLGNARWKQGEGLATLVFRFESTSLPVQRMRVKVEINTREHFFVLAPRIVSYSVDSPWFAGTAEVRTFRTEELLGTKLRALYQRRKGRDLFDLWRALSQLAIDDGRVIECFTRYMAHVGSTVSRAEFEGNLHEKLANEVFVGDLRPLLVDPGDYAVRQAAELVRDRLLSKLPGEPWSPPEARP
ncbi:MAG: nucleotidyl transferase AbiEii/AbiGii toxin family protein [Planctomycetes bacterium]|nr:nucleotidyl transferase AbiEii/AbiGii toxin family protein [Planctomycetota bacterium]